MSLRILVLDNDRDFARTIASRCENLGMHVAVAYGAADAIVQTNLHLPDVFVLDLAQSQLDGMAFCEYLSWNAETKELPVVIMACQDDVEAIRRCCPLNASFVDKSANCWDRLREQLESLSHGSFPRCNLPIASRFS